MAYTFDRFSTQSFERFIQALAAAIGGVRVQIFGAGKDGAREATAEGSIEYLNQSYEGYTVFQAKYLARQDTSAKTVQWIKRQIDLELAKFKNKRRALRTPDNYILATNARLSAASADADGKGAGGIEEVTRYLEAESKSIGIKMVHLWHADTLASLVDAYPALKTTFSSWIEPSDVLANLIREFRAPNQHDTLLRYLRRGFQQARDIKTRDAGQTLSRTLYVSNVFVDLPIDVELDQFDELDNSKHLELDEDDLEWGTEYIGESDTDDRRLRAVYHVLEKAANISPSTLTNEGDRSAKAHNRILILGGPGQGKSTISQFTSQLYRALILNLDRSSNTDEVNEIIDSVRRRMVTEDLPENPLIRLPFQVDLPRYADNIASTSNSGQSTSIMSYLAAAISVGADTPVSSTLLQEWLVSSPCIFILDGLDEVPASGGREQVIDAINQLNDHIKDLKIDAVVLVTSRPQGYQDELSKKHWLYWTLDELQTSEALELAHALAPNLITDAVRRDEVLEILASASSDEATAALMISPLQVTLLFNLVATHNNIPKDRWTLFYRHYETLRDREIAKGGTNGRLIGEYKSQIDRLHYDAGFILHVRAEQPGAANPFFTEDEFEQIVKSRLLEDGFDHDVVKAAQSIVALSTDRLVFLRSGVGGQIAFDVRSLQEFMAAARITLSPEAAVISRLRYIVGKAHWLHVVKIAASRIYGSIGIEALRDPFIAMLDSFNNGDFGEDARLTQIGSRVALDLLTDGAALNIPIYRKRLYTRALLLLESPSQAAPAILARLIEQSTRQVFDSQILEYMNAKGEGARINGIRLLIDAEELSSLSRERLVEIIESSNISEADDFAAVVNDGVYVPQGPVMRDWVLKSQVYGGPEKSSRWYITVFNEPEEIHENTLNAVLLKANGRLRYADVLLGDGSDGDRDAVGVTYFGIAPIPHFQEELVDCQGSWAGVKKLAAFQRQPSVKALHAIVEIWIGEGFDGFRGLPLPWIVAIVYRIFTTCGDQAAFARAIADGAAGDETVWAAAEERWSHDGVKLDEVTQAFDSLNEVKCADKIGMPLVLGRRLGPVTSKNVSIIASYVREDAPDSWWVRTFLSMLRRGNTLEHLQIISSLQPTQSATRRMLLDILLRSMRQSEGDERIINAIVKLTAQDSSTSVLNGAGISTVVERLERHGGPIELLDIVARFALSFTGRRSHRDLIERVAALELSGPTTGRAEHARILFALQARPENLDMAKTLETAKARPESWSMVMDFLGKSSSHPSQISIARQLAAWLLTGSESKSRELAFSALVNELNSQVSMFGDSQITDDLKLPALSKREASVSAYSPSGH